MRAGMLTAATVAMVAANGAVAHAAQLTIGTSPALWPAYRADVPDYTVRCEAGTPVRFEASIPPGQSVAVDGGAAAPDALEQDVSRGAGRGRGGRATGAPLARAGREPRAGPGVHVHGRGRRQLGDARRPLPAAGFPFMGRRAWRHAGVAVDRVRADRA